MSPGAFSFDTFGFYFFYVDSNPSNLYLFILSYSFSCFLRSYSYGPTRWSISLRSI